MNRNRTAAASVGLRSGIEPFLSLFTLAAQPLCVLMLRCGARQARRSPAGSGAANAGFAAPAFGEQDGGGQASAEAVAQKGADSCHRLRLRGLTGAADEFTLAATVQNLRRMAKLLPQGPPLTG